VEKLLAAGATMAAIAGGLVIFRSRTTRP
jgi:hypothetical protein